MTRNTFTINIGLTVNLQAIATQLVGLNLPSAFRRSIFIPDFVMTGKVTSSDEKELIVSATTGNTHVLDYIICKKTDKLRKAIASELSNIKLASVLNDVTGLDISTIPYFGTAVLPTIALTYATDGIDDLPDDLFVSSPLLSSIGKSIEENLQL